MDDKTEMHAAEDPGLRPREHLVHFPGYIAWAVVIVVGLVVFWALLPEYIRAAFLSAVLAQRYLVSMFFGFGLLTLSLLWSTGQSIDAWAFLYFNLRGWRPLWLDRLMLGLTQLGNSLFAFGVALGIFLLGDSRLAYEVVLGTLTLWLVVELVKVLARRSRPFVKLTQARIVGYREIGRSFPSGHTSQAFFLAVLLTRHYHFAWWVPILLYAIAVLVGLTRMYVGAHYPRDVLAGASLGSIWGLLWVAIDARF